MKNSLVICALFWVATNCWGQNVITAATFQVATAIADSPWDMSGFSRTENLIANGLTQSPHVTKEVDNTLDRLIAAPMQKEKAEIRVRVEFSDGGWAQYRMSSINILGGEYGYSYVPGTAVDGAGNTVPDSLVDFSGRYNFTGDAGKRAVAAAARFGSKIEIPLSCETVETKCEVVERDIRCTSTTVIC